MLKELTGVPNRSFWWMFCLEGLELLGYQKFNAHCFWIVKNVVLGTEKKVSYHFRIDGEMDKKALINLRMLKFP